MIKFSEVQSSLAGLIASDSGLNLAVDAETGTNAYLALYAGCTHLLQLLPDKS